MSPPPKKTLFVFDQIRTRSHLLFRYFSTSPQLDAIPHPFLEAASAGPDRWFYDPNIAENGKDVLQNYLPIMSAKTHTPSAEEFADKVAAAHEKVSIDLLQTTVAVANDPWLTGTRSICQRTRSLRPQTRSCPSFVQQATRI